MTVTVVTRWTTKDVPAATENAKRAKEFWMKHGALDVRLNQVFTGEFTGQYIMAQVFADMASYGKAQASAAGDRNFQKILATNVKVGAQLQEREILVSVDIG
ncbi:MAG: hypothetical protein KIT36_07550 [Alphaproteobacteria bacterium]|nr:hypothetical protein [Alphaproteobacteria bacterium]